VVEWADPKALDDKDVTMPKYLVLIYGDEQRWDNASAEEIKQIDDGHRAFQAKVGETILASGQLEPTTTAASLRSGSGGRPAVTDGPFLESKEVLGGFYLLEAAGLDEAISLAGGLAEVSHDHGGVEVRPLVQHA
jgi:hypothetical protein